MLFPYTNVDLVSEIQGRFKVWISCQQKWGGVINNIGTENRLLETWPPLKCHWKGNLSLSWIDPRRGNGEMHLRRQTGANKRIQTQQEKGTAETLLSLKIYTHSERPPAREEFPPRAKQWNNADKQKEALTKRTKKNTLRVLKSNKRKRDYPRPNCSQLV